MTRERCVGINKEGEQCHNLALIGGYCTRHWSVKIRGKAREASPIYD